MRIGIERGEDLTAHEPLEVEEIAVEGGRSGLAFKNETDGVKVSLVGSNAELRSIARQLLHIAGGENDAGEQVASHHNQAATSNPLEKHGIPKTPLRRAGFLKPVKAAQLGKARRCTKKKRKF